jgi:hypothetical protein
MSDLGSYGKITFHISNGEKIRALSFTDMERSASVNITEHRRQGKKPFSEFTGRNLDEITMKIYLSAYLGENPQERYNDLVNYMNQNEAHNIILGGTVLGDNPYCIKQITAPYEKISKNGTAAIIECSVTFTEYIAGKKPSKSTKIKAGTKVKLKGTPLYSSAKAKKTTKKVTGTYYLWDGKKKSGRYCITKKKINVNKKGKGVGWIASSYVNKSKKKTKKKK